MEEPDTHDYKLEYEVQCNKFGVWILLSMGESGMLSHNRLYFFFVHILQTWTSIGF
jgi:hypothetical protein